MLELVLNQENELEVIKVKENKFFNLNDKEVSVKTVILADECNKQSYMKSTLLLKDYLGELKNCIIIKELLEKGKKYKNNHNDISNTGFQIDVKFNSLDIPENILNLLSDRELQNKQDINVEMAIEDFKEFISDLQLITDIGLSGRSGGWLEIGLNTDINELFYIDLDEYLGINPEDLEKDDFEQQDLDELYDSILANKLFLDHILPYVKTSKKNLEDLFKTKEFWKE